MATKNWRVHVNKILANYKKFKEYQSLPENERKAKCMALAEINNPLEMVTLDDGTKVRINAHATGINVWIQSPNDWCDTVRVSKRVQIDWGKPYSWQETNTTWSSGGSIAIGEFINALKLAEKIAKDFEELEIDRVTALL